MKPKMKEFKGKGKRNVQRNDSEDSEARVSEAREGAKAGLSNRKTISILLLLDVDIFVASGSESTINVPGEARH